MNPVLVVIGVLLTAVGLKTGPNRLAKKEAAQSQNDKNVNVQNLPADIANPVPSDGDSTANTQAPVSGDTPN